jgi:DNA-binding response OmpR family regulator
MGWLLVADDDEDLRGSLKDVLRERGYEVRTAADGAEVLDLLASATDPPVAIVLDMLMPRVSGRDVLDALRQGRARGGPVIILSAVVIDAPEVAGVDVVAVFLKPVATQALFDAVEAARTRG